MKTSEQYNEAIQAFINHIIYDKEFVEELLPRCGNSIQLLGNFIIKHSTQLWSKDNPEMEELLDFIDGNGFEVRRPAQPNPSDLHPIEIIPIYEEIEIVYVEKEESKPTFPEFVPVQETPLYYAPMEVDTRPLQECEELFAPRPIRLRIHRCLEFLRLVSTSWGRSAALPRPP